MLAELLEARTREALRSGALEPIETRVERVEDGGGRFALRVVRALERKAKVKREADPFAPPYEPALWVGDVSGTHVCLLNKFPVFERHALLVTRAYEEQTAPLTEADFAALLPWLQAAGGLGFYNSGTGSGASQPHKHLQWVPTPLDLGPDRVPLEPLLRSGRLPVPHAFGPMPASAGEALATCRGLLTRARCETRPYNLLATQEWMLVVPRRAEHFEGSSLNALAFAGSLLVKDDAQLERLKRAGPMRALQAVAG